MEAVGIAGSLPCAFMQPDMAEDREQTYLSFCIALQNIAVD